MYVLYFIFLKWTYEQISHTMPQTSKMNVNLQNRERVFFIIPYSILQNSILDNLVGYDAYGLYYIIYNKLISRSNYTIFQILHKWNIIRIMMMSIITIITIIIIINSFIFSHKQHVCVTTYFIEQRGTYRNFSRGCAHPGPPTCTTTEECVDLGNPDPYQAAKRCVTCTHNIGRCDEISKSFLY